MKKSDAHVFTRQGGQRYVSPTVSYGGMDNGRYEGADYYLCSCGWKSPFILPFNKEVDVAIREHKVDALWSEVFGS